MRSLAAALLASVFLYAAAAKVLNPRGAASTLVALGVAERLSETVSRLLPFAEVFFVVLLLKGATMAGVFLGGALISVPYSRWPH